MTNDKSPHTGTPQRTERRKMTDAEIIAFLRENETWYRELASRVLAQDHYTKKANLYGAAADRLEARAETDKASVNKDHSSLNQRVTIETVQQTLNKLRALAVEQRPNDVSFVHDLIDMIEFAAVNLARIADASERTAAATEKRVRYSS